MDTVRSIALSLCVTLAVTALFSMLVPSGKFDRVLKFAVSLFFLLSLISPFVNQKIRFPVQSISKTVSFDTKPMENTYRSRLSSLTEQRLAANIEHQLALDGISAKKVDVSISIAQDESISINKLIVSLSESDLGKGRIVSAKIQREIGVTPQVVYEK